MSFWTAIVIIVAVGVLSEMYKSKLRAQSGKAEELAKETEERIAKIEARMANLETILLRREKEKRFDDL